MGIRVLHPFDYRWTWVGDVEWRMKVWSNCEMSRSRKWIGAIWRRMAKRWGRWQKVVVSGGPTSCLLKARWVVVDAAWGTAENRGRSGVKCIVDEMRVAWEDDTEVDDCRSKMSVDDVVKADGLPWRLYSRPKAKRHRNSLDERLQMSCFLTQQSWRGWEGPVGAVTCCMKKVSIDWQCDWLTGCRV